MFISISHFVSFHSFCVREATHSIGNMSRWPWLSGRSYLNNLMRQGSNNHQTTQPEWDVTAKENEVEI